MTHSNTGFAVNQAKTGKIRHVQTFKVWTFVTAMFRFLVVCMVKMWSDRKKSSWKDSWYQNYLVLLTTSLASCHEQSASFARNRPQHLNASCVCFGRKNHLSNYRSPSVVVISIQPGLFLLVCKMTVRSLIHGKTGSKFDICLIQWVTWLNPCVTWLNLCVTWLILYDRSTGRCERV